VVVTLLTQRDLQSVQRLPFCYLCGKPFVEEDATNRDHVPPECTFRRRDRQPLILKTHRLCNFAHKSEDEKVGQLIALRRGEYPAIPKNRRLRFAHFPAARMSAVENLNVEAAIWRWVRGFHAALYRQPMPADARGSIHTPFPRADRRADGIHIRPILPQHLAFVDSIKANRLHKNFDGITCNSGKLKYECAWFTYDNDVRWFCVFALDIYDWKELGATSVVPARGCAGCYALPDHSVPESATQGIRSALMLPNYDRLDPFSA
jgi:hypothetical protein